MLAVIFVRTNGFQKGYGFMGTTTRVVTAHDVIGTRAKAELNVKQRLKRLKPATRLAMAKGSRKRLSDADVQEMRRLAKAGWSASDIGRKFNCSASYAQAVTSGSVRRKQ